MSSCFFSRRTAMISNLLHWRPRSVPQPSPSCVLPEHGPTSTPISSATFAAEAQLFRTYFDYRERPTLQALLTSFFLHIYFSNADKLRSAAHFLRESLTYAQQMFLHEPDTYQSMACEEYELRLRIYWILFVSERCQENATTRRSSSLTNLLTGPIAFRTAYQPLYV